MVPLVMARAGVLVIGATLTPTALAPFNSRLLAGRNPTRVQLVRPPFRLALLQLPALDLPALGAKCNPLVLTLVPSTARPPSMLA